MRRDILLGPKNNGEENSWFYVIRQVSVYKQVLENLCAKPCARSMFRIQTFNVSSEVSRYGHCNYQILRPRHSHHTEGSSLDHSIEHLEKKVMSGCTRIPLPPIPFVSRPLRLSLSLRRCGATSRKRDVYCFRSGGQPRSFIQRRDIFKMDTSPSGQGYPSRSPASEAFFTPEILASLLGHLDAEQFAHVVLAHSNALQVSKQYPTFRRQFFLEQETGPIPNRCRVNPLFAMILQIFHW